MALLSTRRRIARLLQALVYVAALAGVAACGSSGSGYSNFAGDSGGGNDLDGTIPGDDGGGGSSSSGGSSSGGTTCAPGCTSDQDCQNSCPAAQSGSVNCCDVPSGTCMMMNLSACPPPVDSGAVE